MKRVTQLVLILIISTVSLFSDNFITEVKSSTSTDISHPGEYAVDGNLDRGWSLDPKENRGWVEISLDSLKEINGIIFDGELSSNSRISISYADDSGIFRDFMSSLYSPIELGKVLDLSFDKVLSNKIKIKLYEDSSKRSLITDIKLLTEDPYKDIKLQKPYKISASSTSSVYSPEHNLLDGNPETYWRIENNLDWSNVQWAVKQYLDNRYKYDRYSSWGNSGSVVFDFDNQKISNIRFFVSGSVNGSYKIEIYKNNIWSDIVSGERLAAGWNTNSIENSKLEKVRLTVISDNQNNFPSVGEVEFWGEEKDSYNINSGDEKDSVYLTPEYQPELLGSLDETYFKWELKDSLPEIEVAILKDNFNSLYFNGKKIEPSKIISNKETSVLVYKPNKNDFLDGYNFVKLKDNVGIKLRYSDKRGSLVKSEDSLRDGLLYSNVNVENNQIIVFDSLVKLQQIDLFNNRDLSVSLYANVDGTWFELQPEELNEYKRVYKTSLKINSLKISSTEDAVTELRVWGSQYPDNKPDIKILYPFNGIDMESHKPGYSVLVGEVDQLGCDITVNGIKAKTYGNIFWVELKKLKLPKAGIADITTTAVNNDNISATDNISILLQHNGFEDSVDGEEFIFTNKGFYTITGNSNQWTSKLYINDEELPINGHKFSHDVKLEPGYNQFRIEFRNKKNEIVKLFVKTIYREYGDLILKTSQSYNNIITRNDKIKIKGFVKGVGETKVAVNGLAVKIEDYSFISHDIILNEGSNTITIVATDESDNKIEENITIIKDSIAPSIGEVNPLEGTIISKDDVTFTGYVSEDLGTRVFVNGNIASIDGTLFTRELFLSDGVNPIEIYAVDRAGNKSEVFISSVMTDTTPPEDFNVIADPGVWTNNVSPNILFKTEDVTSGIDFYEIKIDDSDWSVVTSPFTLPEQEDGIHRIYIRATDNAGHSSMSSTKVYIDTVCPEAPPVLRTISKIDKISLKWEKSPSEDTIHYRVERTPNWDSGYKLLDDEVTEFVDTEVNPDMVYEYKLIAVDRAYNESQKVISDKKIASQEVEPYNSEDGTVLEFDKVSLIIPSNAFDEDIVEIVAVTRESEVLEEKAQYPIAGPIYNFSVVKKVDGELYLQEHIEFENDFLGVFEYKEEDLPNGFPEQNIGVFYFDPFWGRWFQEKTAAVDIENNKIYFKTNHFTDFSVQPVMFTDMEPQDVKDVGYSPFETNMSHSGVNVSPMSGASSMEVTEFVLPGKGGFDFKLSRSYDSTVARSDSPSEVFRASLNIPGDIAGLAYEAANLLIKMGYNLRDDQKRKMLDYYFNNGDFAYSMGVGWRLNLPYVLQSNTSVLLRMPNGSMHNVNKMVKVRNSESGIVNERTVEFKNKEGEDFTFIVDQVLFDGESYTIKTLSKAENLSDSAADVIDEPLRKALDLPLEEGFDPASTIGSAISILTPGWTTVSSTLILKDGTTYYFDNRGRVKQIVDPSGLNTVDFKYNNKVLKSITDSMGRTLKFTYKDCKMFGGTTVFEGISYTLPRISSIKLESKDETRTITYDLENKGNGLLKTATDFEGRKWEYTYDEKDLFAGGGSFKINILFTILDNIAITKGVSAVAQSITGVSAISISGHLQFEHVNVIDSLDGPGLGKTVIDYNKDTLMNLHAEPGDYLFGLIPTAIKVEFQSKDKIVVNRIYEYNGVEFKTTSYDYHFSYAGHNQFYNRKTTINDGQVKTIHRFAKTRKRRDRWIDTSDRVYDTIESRGITQSPHIYEYIPYNTSIERYDISNDDKLIEKIVINTNTNTFKPKSQTRYISTNESNYSKTEFEYDNWGNQTYINKVSSLNGVESRIEQWDHYINTSSDGSGITWPEGFDNTSTLKRNIYNLVGGTVVKNYYPSEHGSDPVFLYTNNTYNTNGLKKSSRIWDGLKWQPTKFEYNENGNVKKITNPLEHVTTLNYDYTTSTDWYTVTKTEKAVNSGESDRDLVSVVGYGHIMGDRLWTKNPRGYITKYCYDKLGRVTGIKKPKDNDEDSITPSLITKDDSDITLIEYNDTENLVTETNTRGAKTTFSYDNRGQLTNIEKINRVIGVDLKTKTGDEIVVETKIDYDKWGNITSITDPEDNKTLYDYDAQGRVTSITYPSYNGKQATKTITYDPEENSATTVNENGFYTKQYFNLDNKNIRNEYFSEHHLSLYNEYFYYDSLGNKVLSIDGNGNDIKVFYDTRNLVSKIELPSENYYEDGVEYTDISSYIEYEYNALGQKTAEIKNSLNNNLFYRSEYTLNALGQITKVAQGTITTEPEAEFTQLKAEETVYDENGNLESVKDGRENITRFTYDSRDQLKTETNPLNEVITYDYDSEGNKSFMSDPRDSKDYSATFNIEYFYDDLNRVIGAKLPKGFNQTEGYIKLNYDKKGNVTSRIEPDNSVTAYDYSPRNWVTEEIKKGTIDSEEGILTTFTYDQAGNRIKIEDDTSITLEESYDSLNRKVKQTTAGSVERFSYDNNGNQILYEDGRGNITESKYDSFNRLEEVIDAKGNSLHYKYDINGNQTLFIDANGTRNENKYDRLSRLTNEKNGLGYEYIYTYDGADNIETKTDPNGTVFTYTYSDTNLLEEINAVNGAKSHKISYDYDEAGDLKSSTDKNIKTYYNYHNHKYQADPFSRVFNITNEVDSKTFSLNYNYDIMGRVNQITYPTDQIVEYEYNNLGQLLKVPGYIDEEITYFDNGYLNEYTLSNGVKYSKTLDDSNRLSSFNYSIGLGEENEAFKSYEFNYDRSNNISRKIINDNENTYSWDQLNQLTNSRSVGDFEIDPTKVDQNQIIGTVTEDYIGKKRVDFTARETELKLDYNAISIGFDLGSYVKINRFIIYPDTTNHRLMKNKVDIYYSDSNANDSSNTNNWTLLNKGEWSYVVNDDGSIEISLRKPVQTQYVKVHCILDDRDISGDAKDLAEVRNSTKTLITAYYTVSIKNEFFEYDNAGNRIYYKESHPQIDDVKEFNYELYENSNRIKSDEDFTYIWDQNGNLVEKGTNFNEADNKFSETTGEYWLFEYDLFNRLKTVSKSLKGSNSKEQLTTYSYDHRGYRIKGSGSKGVTYYSFGLDGNILYTESGDTKEEIVFAGNKHLAKNIRKGLEITTLFLHTDHLGSIVSMTDTAGEEVWSNDYTAFGKSTLEAGLIEEIGVYTGKTLDPDTGLYYFNARWYDPNLGRFTTEDPIKDGNNWYVYCSNNPLINIDPTGLSDFVSLKDYVDFFKELNINGDAENNSETRIPLVGPIGYGKFDLLGVESFNSTGSVAGDFGVGFIASAYNLIVGSTTNFVNNMSGHILDHTAMPILELFGAGIGAVDNYAFEKLGGGLNEQAANLLAAGYFPGQLAGAGMQCLGYYGTWGKAAFAARFFSGAGDDIAAALVVSPADEIATAIASSPVDELLTFRGPAKRHFFNKINQKTLAKAINTVIDPKVNVADDLTAINSGIAKKVAGNFHINGRIYGAHNGTIYPISGNGFYQLNRATYKSLGILNQFGNTERSMKILSNMGMDSTTINQALDVWRKLK